MKSWKSTLGGSFSAAGSMMVGIGVVPQLAGQPSHLLNIIAMIGFGLNVLGTFFAHLFAADQTAVINLQNQINEQNKAT